MSRRSRSMGRRIAALVVAAGAATFGASIVMGAGHASAQGIPTKTCTGSGASGEAVAGSTITCTIDIDGLLANGSGYVITPSAPTGAYIPANGCSGASGGTAPLSYQTTATETGGGTTSSSCTFIVSTGAIAVGQNQIGTETLFIPPGIAAGTSVTQTAAECLTPPNATTLSCGPATPMGVSGAGSCVGGAALPVLGGCEPGLPGTSPSASASASASGGGASPTPVASSTTPQPTSAVAAARTTPFTGGPDHPFPVAATGIALAGAALALAAGFGPGLLRRRRSAAALHRDD